MCDYGKPVFGKVTEQFPIVETTHGKIVGENRDRVAVFRGIPYGGPCAGEHRFMAPVEAQNWSGVKDCTRNGPICVQPGESIAASKNFRYFFTGGHPEKFGVKNETQDENCLVLNVVTPGLDRSNRPVLVYFHGGGFATNSGTTGIGSDGLAREQDVVIVSVNHRLHIWGYLYLGAFDDRFRDSGNAGSLDLILALKWVKENIANFGGNPENITVMGESGGAAKTNTALHMKEAVNLFHKGIVISGSMPVGKLTKDKAAESAERYLYQLGIKPKELDRLFRLPADYMMWNAFDMNKFDMMEFQPVADGIHLMEAQGDGFEPAPFAKDIPLIIGASEDEMAAFCPETSFDITDENVRQKLLERGPGLGVNVKEENADRVLAVFKQKNIKLDTADHMFLKIVSVANVLCSGAYYQSLASARTNSANVYSYLNKLDVTHNYITSRKYAWHTFELPLGLRIVPYVELEELSKIISAAWGNFIRTGNPSTGNLQWLPFTPEEKLTMVFDDVCRMEKDPLKEERSIIEEISGNH